MVCVLEIYSKKQGASNVIDFLNDLFIVIVFFGRNPRHEKKYCDVTNEALIVVYYEHYLILYKKVNGDKYKKINVFQ